MGCSENIGNTSVTVSAAKTVQDIIIGWASWALLLCIYGFEVERGWIWCVLEKFDLFCTVTINWAGVKEITNLKTGAAAGSKRSSLCLSSFPSLKHQGLSWGYFRCLTRLGTGEDCAAGASRQAQPGAAFCLWWFWWLMHRLTTSLFLRGKCEAVVNLVSDQRHCSHMIWSIQTITFLSKRYSSEGFMLGSDITCLPTGCINRKASRSTRLRALAVERNVVCSHLIQIPH